MSGGETSVAATLATRIAQHGPLPLDEVMAVAVEAYYAQGDVFGRDGDFITAPEISQVFGELIGLWCAATWQQLGAPRPFHLVECGPGRGTLMADALRAASKVPGFLDAAEIHLVERSAALRGRQKAALPQYRVQWHDDVTDIPSGPTLLVANEFLDALPLKQFVRTADGWAERYVTHTSHDGFAFIDKPAPPPSNAPKDAATGAIIERSPAIDAFVCTLAKRLVENSGAALLIDYGYTGPAVGDTLQAVKAHRFHPVLADLGAADITAHVDFTAVRRAAENAGARAFGPEPQGTWLTTLGIGLRAAQLSRGKPVSQAAEIAAAFKRLTAPDGMGLLFKVMGIATLARLEGFAQDAP